MTKEYLKQLIESGDTFAIYFYNKGCGHCKEVDKVLKNTLPITNHDGNPVMVYKLELIKNQQLGDSLDVKNVPSLLVVKQDEFTRYIGSQEITTYINSL